MVFFFHTKPWDPIEMKQYSMCKMEAARPPGGTQTVLTAFSPLVKVKFSQQKQTCEICIFMTFLCGNDI